MAGGTFNATEEKVRPGLYVRFETAALARITGGNRGVVAIPVKAHWGPVGEVVEIATEGELIRTFTDSKTEGATAYQAILEALRGGPSLVRAYRMANGASPATLTLEDNGSPPQGVANITAKYPGARGNNFRVSVAENLSDNSKQDIFLLEGVTQLASWTVAKGSITAVVDAINNDKANIWVTATKVADGTGTLRDVTSISMMGGASGIAGITNSDYVQALEALEAYPIHVATLDGATDSSLQASFASWIERNRSEGKWLTGVIGGTTDGDRDRTTSNNRSTSFNSEYITNLTVGVKYADGTVLSSAEFAPRIAGMIAGADLVESLTYAVVPYVSDVNVRLTNAQVITSLQAGSLILVWDGEKVVVEQGINTLTSLKAGQDDGWKKIRRVRTRDQISDDITRTANDAYVGKVNNTPAGQAALMTAIRQYLRTLESAGALLPGSEVELDPDRPPVGDSVWLLIGYTDADSMEKIYLTFRVGPEAA